MNVNNTEMKSSIDQDEEINENKVESLQKQQAIPASKINIRSPQREPFAKKMRIEVSPNARKHIPVYNYGNYDRYYGYRNFKYFDDIRLDAFKLNTKFFHGLDILDIGCNNGLITIALARDFHVKSITGIDIDKSLIRRAREHMVLEKKQCTSSLSTDNNSFPNNILFKQGNYVLSDESLLELEHSQFDTILCLSVTKWIHLNFGDKGLKITFKRMFKQLRHGGQLILEAQDWKSYKRRKKLTDTIYENFKNIKFLPNQFEEYLLGPEVGFTSSYLLDLPKHKSNGFCRPIQVKTKLILINSYLMHFFFFQ